MEIKEPGFTYTEILVALIIVVIGFILVFNMSIIAVSTGNFNKEVLSAKELASTVLDSIQGLSFNDSLLTDDGDTTDLMDISNPDHIYQLTGRDDDRDGRIDEEIFNRIDDDNDGLIDEDLKVFSIVINIANNQPLVDTKTVSVIVYWKYKGVIRKVEMETIKRKI